MYKAVAEIFSFIYDLSNKKNKLDEKLKKHKIRFDIDIRFFII